MRIWFFDKYSGELIPSMEEDKGQEALLSPREQGKIIESIYSTTIAPPDYSENETVIFKDSTWEVQPDYRELIAWYKKDGSPVSITDIGVEPDREYVETAPGGTVQPVWDETAGKWREKTEKELYAELYSSDRDKAVTVMRHECELALVNVHYRKELPFKGYHVRADEKSQNILTGMIAELAYGSRTFPIPWIVCENKFIPVENNTEMLELVTMISQSVQQSILANTTAKKAIDNAADFEMAWAIFTAFRDAEI